MYIVYYKLNLYVERNRIGNYPENLVVLEAATLHRNKTICLPVVTAR